MSSAAAATAAAAAGSPVNVNSVPQDLQNMKLVVVDIGNGSTVEIPLQGRIILHNSGSLTAADDAAGAAAARGGCGTGTAPGQSFSDTDLDNMRGWLLTVATLFVGMAFQAMTQPPDWVQKMREAAVAALADPSNKDHRIDPSLSPALVRESLFTLANTLTFSSALALTLLLLRRPRSDNRARVLGAMKFLAGVTTFFVALAFALAATVDLPLLMAACLGTLLYSTLPILFVEKAHRLPPIFRCRRNGDGTSA
ncbi:hypothetical protein BS78_09G065400 [Paspalum vaginatum]|nr:hypothetical protein BS78_09G065400 [Paspalum vaginatum]